MWDPCIQPIGVSPSSHPTFTPTRHSDKAILGKGRNGEQANTGLGLPLKSSRPSTFTARQAFTTTPTSGTSHIVDFHPTADESAIKLKIVLPSLWTLDHQTKKDGKARHRRQAYSCQDGGKLFVSD